jgi:hypothetical protein
MKIILTEDQYKRLIENFDQVLDLFSKRKRGETLKPSENDVLRSFEKYTKKGGDPEDFIFDPDEYYDYVDEREGMKFKYNLKGRPFTFEFSEEMDKGDTIEYYGEITFNGDEFLGVIVTDKRGYLIDYDFYSVLSDDDVRLQDILKSEDSEAEVQNFFQEEVINRLRQ